jgi:hypothetical protein
VQQSAVVVHTELGGAQDIALHVSSPFAPGKQGMPLQQSASDAHAPFTATHAVSP